LISVALSDFVVQFLDTALSCDINRIKKRGDPLKNTFSHIEKSFLAGVVVDGSESVVAINGCIQSASILVRVRFPPPGFVEAALFPIPQRLGNRLPSHDLIPKAHEDDQVDLFDNERFARAASAIDPTEAFLFQLRRGVTAPAGFTAQQFLTGRSNLSQTPILTELGKIATAISA
jgi:hypothetical protein